MSLPPGTRLGPYEILAPLGAGGMGEVYRARDTRLDRDVAVKVLPATFAADPDRLARFEREAKAIAALSHPNILSIYDTGVHDGRMFVVTELLDGETLRERLNPRAGGAVESASAAMPVRKAVDIAAQVARGLAAAHEKGIVHRDLKPENVFLLKDGQVKILDFGLARQVPDPSGVAETTSPLTDPGVVMGTVGYMAPEQVRGQTVDARADLFSLGAVLYEMLSGRRAFKRDTSVETMTAILNEDPSEIGVTRADISPALDRIVRHCLEKNPAERFQSARDVAFALEALTGSTTSVQMPVSVPRKRWPVAASISILAVGAVGIAVGQWLKRTPTPIAFEVKTWNLEWITNARFAPDGQTIVFSSATSGNVPDLFVIRPDMVAAQPLGQKATELLSVSSKGEIAVLINAINEGPRLFVGTLARMTLDGAPRPWLEHIRDADWSPDGSTLAVVRDLGSGRDRIEYPIGTPLYEAGGYLNDVRVSPDGHRVAFYEHQILGDDRGWIRTVDMNRKVTTLGGEYVGAEGIAWARDGRSVLFSASTGHETGPLYNLMSVDVGAAGHVRLAVPNAGSLVVQDVNAAGRVLALQGDLRTAIRLQTEKAAEEREFRWLDQAIGGFQSPTGDALLFTDGNRAAGVNYAVSLHRRVDGSVVRLGEGTAVGFSKDGKWAVGLLPSAEQFVLYPTGPGEPRRISRGPIEHYLNTPLQWLQDGRLVICGNERTQPPRCYAQKVSDDSPNPITPAGITNALVAPDGSRVLVHLTDDTYALALLGPDGQIGPSHFPMGGLPMSWSRDGRSVYFQLPGVPARIEKVDPATGAHELVKELAPADRTGVIITMVTEWKDDGQSFTYLYARGLTQLFVISGVEQR
jgi:serine/threonine protein kinase